MSNPLKLVYGLGMGWDGMGHYNHPLVMPWGLAAALCSEMGT